MFKLSLLFLLLAQSPASFSYFGTGTTGYKKHLENESLQDSSMKLRKAGQELLFELAENSNITTILITGRAHTSLKRGLVSLNSIELNILADGVNIQKSNITTGRDKDLFQHKIILKHPDLLKNSKLLSISLGQDANLEITKVEMY
jgi:hypothetical protein